MKLNITLIGSIIITLSAMHPSFMNANPTTSGKPTIDAFIMMLKQRAGADVALVALEKDPTQILTLLEQTNDLFKL